MPKTDRSGWATGPVDNSEDLDRRAERYRALLGVDDLDALTDQLLSLRKARRKEDPLPRRTYDLGGPLPEAGMEIAPLDASEEVSISRGRRPKKAIPSWGLTGRYVRVSAPEPFGFARLRFALPKGRLKRLYPGTIVAARWDAYLGRFRLIPASGYSESGEYVYAQVTRPGTFTAIGLPRDPRLLSGLRLLSSLSPWAEAAKLADMPILQPMVDALFDQPLPDHLATDPDLLETFGYRRADFPADMAKSGLGGAPLDEIVDKLPELDLLDALAKPARTIKPIPDLRLPEEWPMPMGRWESLGPETVTGRIKRVVTHPEDGDIIYAGAAGGGVWKTINGGRDWHATMHYEPSLAIGGLAIAPSNPNVLYAATGEWTGGVGRPHNPAALGAGVLRTSDGGAHWELCAPIDSDFCSSVAIDPRDPDRVFVGGEAGLYRSRDGGLTWDRGPDGMAERDREEEHVVGRGGIALFNPGEISDVKIAPDDSDRIYIGVHGRGVFRSLDGGDSFHPLTEGIETDADHTFGEREAPGGICPKIALGRNGPNGSGFVAVKMANRVYLSRDGGIHFTRTATDTRRSPKDFYPWCSVIAVDPRDENRIYAGSVDLFRSDDGGASWTNLTAEIHEDQQQLIFDPRDPDRLILANDGGVWDSDDRGDTFYLISDGLVAGQFYNVAVTQGPKFRVAGAMHDESGHVREPSGEWRSLGLYEGGVVAFDPDDDDVLYHSSYINALHQFSISSSTPANDLLLQPMSITNQSIEFGPNGCVFVIDNMHYSPRELIANQVVRKRPVENSAHTTALQPEAGPFTVLAASPTDRSIIYAGTVHGNLWRSDDGGQNWRTTMPSAAHRILSISVDTIDSNRIYLNIGNIKYNKIFRSDINSRTYYAKILRLNLESNNNFSNVVQHPALEDTLFAVSGSSGWTSYDAGFYWTPNPQSGPKINLTKFAVHHSSRQMNVATLGGGQFTFES